MQFWGREDKDQVVLKAGLLLEVLGKDPSLPSASSDRISLLVAMAQSLPLTLSWLLLCVYQFSHCLSLLRTPVFGIRIYLDDPEILPISSILTLIRCTPRYHSLSPLPHFLNDFIQVHKVHGLYLPSFTFSTPPLSPTVTHPEWYLSYIPVLHFLKCVFIVQWDFAMIFGR